MSIAFEAFVVKELKENVKVYLEKEKFEVCFFITEIQEGLTGLAVDYKDMSFDQKRNEKIAIKLAQKFEKCLVTYWDDRVGVCLSELYNQEGLLKSFGQEDEVWFECQNIYVNTRGVKYSGKDIDELYKLNKDKGYDCVFNAIDAGLFALERFVDVTCVGFIDRICSAYDDE
jgi:hypothetical protein